MSTSFTNALGVRLFNSADPTSWFGSSARAAPLWGTAGPDALYGTGFGAVLTGGGDDDTYHLWDIRDRVVEAPGQGIDTLVLHAPDYATGYTLPANVENLIVTSDRGWGAGNSLDNLVFGDVGRQYLTGGAGADVIAGGAGSDVFVFERGDGRDVITDFQPGQDLLAVGSSLAGFGSFAALRAAMTQSGADTILNFGGGDSITFRNRQVGDFSATDFRLPADTTALVSTFAEEFNTFRVSPTGLIGAETAWRSTYWWGRTIPTNNEAEFYSDHTTPVNPFSLSGDGVLSIRAAPATGLPAGLTHTSGVITTLASHVQTYGYFEMRAMLPAGEGFWPAFWLLQANGTWPPEIDVMEMIGDSTTSLHVNVHSQATGSHTVLPAVVPLEDLSAGFNTFAVSWRPDVIRFYLNGTEVYQAATPDDMHRPMYMLANLAVGGPGSWPGPADAGASATMKIDFIRAYQYQDLLGPAQPAAGSVVVTQGGSANDTITGGVGADRIGGGAGNDRLTGRDGADVFIIRGGEGRDVITDFKPGVDKLMVIGINPERMTTTVQSDGLELAAGSTRVKLLGVSKLGAGDVVSGALDMRGTTGADLLNRSTATFWQTMSGLEGNDTIRGGSGNDWIDGGTGDDLMRGGAGRDSFVFRVWSGDDRIEDFQSGQDRLVFEGVVAATIHVNAARVNGVAGIEVNYGQASPGTTVDHGTATDSIFLPGVTQLVAGDIVIA
jgi:beta-glucanase (GH16 family)/Ca2+-binding RTX toxin-like protein